VKSGFCVRLRRAFWGVVSVGLEFFAFGVCLQGGDKIGVWFDTERKKTWNVAISLIIALVLSAKAQEKRISICTRLVMSKMHSLLWYTLLLLKEAFLYSSAPYCNARKVSLCVKDTWLPTHPKG